MGAPLPRQGILATALQRVRFMQWEFLYDRAATAAAYAAMGKCAAERGSGDCRAWIAHRRSAFTPEVLALFGQLGIDVEKETYVSGLAVREGDPGSYLFMGEYHFMGRLLSGPDCCVPFDSGDGYSIRPTRMNATAKYGVTAVRSTNPTVPQAFRAPGVLAIVFHVGPGLRQME